MALIKCPECGKEVSDRSGICVYCGYPLNEQGNESEKENPTIICPECGKEIPSDVESCPNCGYPIRGNDEVESPKHQNYSIKCPVCGTVDFRGNKYCSKCGQDLTNITRNADKNKASWNGEEEKKESKFTIVGFVFAALGLFSIFFTFIAVICGMVSLRSKKKAHKMAKWVFAVAAVCMIMNIMIFGRNSKTDKVTESAVSEEQSEKTEMPEEYKESLRNALQGQNINFDEISGISKEDDYAFYGVYSFLCGKKKYVAYFYYDGEVAYIQNEKGNNLYNSERYLAEKSNKTEDNNTTYTQDLSKEAVSPKDELQNILNTGIYIIGQDLDAGKYDFSIESGNGELKIYNSYEDYKNDENGFDAPFSFDVLADGASRGLLNTDNCTSEIRNIRLSENQCLVLDGGAKISYVLSGGGDNSNISVGVYIIGEDFEAGKYSFTAIKGMGELQLYNSYDEFLQDTYGFDAFADYDMRAEGADVGLTNEDIYTEKVSNIILEDDQCMVITKGLVLECE